MKPHVDVVADLRQRLVDPVVDDLPDALHQTPGIGGSDVPSRHTAYGVEALEDAPVTSVLRRCDGGDGGLGGREGIESGIEPGMVVSMAPIITSPAGRPGAGGYRAHDRLVVGDDGVDNITKFPYGPEHNIVRA